MNAVTGYLSPSITNLIRGDHTKVLATFHRYKAGTSPRMKEALASAVCLSVEIHAQCEEEIFYPAVRALDPALVEKNVPEHDAMRLLIHTLRRMSGDDPQYDNTFMALMREIIHHVADEETILLPDAERALGEERLCELGAAMMKRKLQLMAPQALAIARNTARAPQTSTMLTVAGALIAGGYLLSHALKSRSSA